MADMPNLPFITKNPALEEFRTQRKSDVDYDTLRQAVEEKDAGAPSRLRTLSANADINESHARSTKAVEPYAGPMAQAGLRQANAHAKHSEMEGFYKSLDLLNNGHVDAAREVSRRWNSDLPDSVVQDAELRSALTAVAEVAKRDYPQHPAVAQNYMKGAVEEFQKRRAEGQRLDATAPYTVPNTPTAPETSGVHNFEIINRSEMDENGKPVVRSYRHDKRTGTLSPVEGEGAFQRPTGAGGAGGGQRQPAKIQAAQWLLQNGVAPDEATAWQMVNTSVDNPVRMRQQIYNNALRATYGNAQRAQEITSKAMDFLGMPVQPAPAPRQPPAPAPQRPDLMTPGDGNVPRDITLPARPLTVPPGSGYSPGTQTWHTRDGRSFDAQGNPIQ